MGDPGRLWPDDDVPRLLKLFFNSLLRHENKAENRVEMLFYYCFFCCQIGKSRGENIYKIHKCLVGWKVVVEEMQKNC